MNKDKIALTFIGMSGLGKTHLSKILAKDGWDHYSADYHIATDYMADYIDVSNISIDDIRPISEFIGKLGNPSQNGLMLGEFKRRQALYNKAEHQAGCDVIDHIKNAKGHFVHDSTGSFCALDDERLYASLAEHTLFVYLEADEDDEAKIIQRATEYPKPLYYTPEFLIKSIEQYLSETGTESTDDIDPNAFSRWIFPKLFYMRIPKYQRLADLYGVTIPAKLLRNVTNSAEFLDILYTAIDKKKAKIAAA